MHSTWKSWHKWTIGIVGLLFVFVAVIGSLSPDEVPTHKERIQALFSSYDGSNANLILKVTSQMNDPKSFDHLQTGYVDQDSVVYVSMEYTAKNGFGGTIRCNAIAYIDTTGKVIQILKIE